MMYDEVACQSLPGQSDDYLRVDCILNSHHYRDSRKWVMCRNTGAVGAASGWPGLGRVRPAE